MSRMQPTRSRDIVYINPETPQVEPPDYAGQWIEALAPDTLDLQEMARIAVNGLTEPTDAGADYEIYWRAAFNTNPPVMWHSESDIVQAKFMEALPLMRLVSGSDQNLHVEQRWMEVIRQMQGPDGLLYLPKIGRPWCAFGSYGNEPPGDHYFSPWFEGRLLGAMTIYHRLTSDDEWLKAGRRVVDGLSKLVVHEGRKAHFPCHEFGTEGRYNPPADPASAVHNPATYHSWCIQGLANHAKHTGFEPALELAGKLSRWVLEDSNHFDADGRFLEEYPGVRHVHFHGHTMVLLALLDYGLAAGDQSAVDFAHRGFRYALTQGECLLGYFPEWLNVERVQTLELCELADMIALALKLSAAGVSDHWDMADRWIRNLFFEAQLRTTHWIDWLGERTATTEIAPPQLPPYHVTDRVAERNIGAFGGWLSPNDWLPDFPHDCQWRAPGIMHCCTGNATRAIYYIWEHILTQRDGELRVNLLLNRASAWAEVDSHIPCKGQVDIRVKQPVSLSVRVPEWAEPEEIVCAVNGSVRQVTFEGRYAQIGRVGVGDTVTLECPIPQRREWLDIEKRTYRVLLRGNTCVAIEPPGRNFPIFQRDHYTQDLACWRRIMRFVPERAVEW